MVTTEQKNKIESIWQAFYNGGMSVQTTIVDQLCVLMYLKMLDDKQSKMEASATAINEKLKESLKIFKKGDWENPETNIKIPYDDLRWSNFKNLNAVELPKRIRDYCFPFIKNLTKDNSDVFAKFLSDVSYGFDGKQEVLVKVVDMMSDIDFTDNDAMGDFFEHLIDGKINGQFRTPRHIIDMMVNMVQPVITDYIIDPAMGTAGFLIETAKYLKSKYKKELLNIDNKKFFQTEQFTGVDTESVMARIGCMNLIFHDCLHPDLSTRSLLIEENNKNYINKFDVVLANPPFAGSLDSSTTDSNLLAITNTRKTELLFVALFIRLLKIGGKCASIVPDGVLTGDKNAFISVKKNLVEEQKLKAVVSLPANVFQPYSGVKTSFIIFEKTGNGGTDNVWFYEMEGDGYTLDAQRNPDPEHDDCEDVVKRYNNLDKEKNRTRYDKSFLVPIDEIRANNYDLSFKKYKQVKRENIEYRKPREILKDLKKLNALYDKTFEELLN